MTRAIDVASAGTIAAMLAAYVKDVVEPTLAEGMPEPPSADYLKLSSIYDFIGGAMGALTLLEELTQRPNAPSIGALLQRLQAECVAIHIQFNPDNFRKKDGS